MYYTKIALLTFGIGLVLGLAVVVIEIDWLGRVASGLMALGLMAIPIGMIVDWRLATKIGAAAAESTRRDTGSAQGWGSAQGCAAAPQSSAAQTRPVKAEAIGSK